MTMREQLPVNVMFLIEETMSIFNLFYQGRLDKWAKENFSTNRLGDMVNHSRHAARGIFSLHNLSQEYVDSLEQSHLTKLIPQSWKESPEQILKMITEIRKFDTLRNQSWTNTFPEIAEFYKRYM